MRDAALHLVLERTASRMNWAKPMERTTSAAHLRRGRGIGLGFKAVVAPTTSVAMVNLSGDGSCIVYSSTVEMGQGSDTAMALMAGEVLGIQAEKIKVVKPDTDVTPYDMATLGSRSTFHMGHAVRLAAEDVLLKLQVMATELGESDCSAANAANLLKKKYGMQAGNVIGVGNYIPSYTPPNYETGQSENITPNWMIGACGVEVEVDIETGHVKILRMENVVDCGTAINPQIVETQLSGAAIMQLGISMFEEMEFDDMGQLRNASFAEYKIPGMQDIPVVMGNEIVQARQTNGPFGAKGVGESATFGVASAIAEAIEDAVGVRLTTMPMKPETVYRAIAKANGQALANP